MLCQSHRELFSLLPFGFATIERSINGCDKIASLIKDNELINQATLIGQQQEDILAAIEEFKPDLNGSNTRNPGTSTHLPVKGRIEKPLFDYEKLLYDSLLGNLQCHSKSKHSMVNMVFPLKILHSCCQGHK